MTKVSKTKIIFGSIIIILLFVLYFVATHGFIAVSHSAGKELKYTFINQANGSSTEVISTDGKVKKLLSAGTYEVYAQNETESYITVSKANGFLTTAKVSVSLRKENIREFVGENAAPCTNFIGDRLFSYECGGELSSVTEHVPAESAQPTYTLKTEIDTPGTVEDVAYTKQGIVILTGAVFLNEEELLTNYRLGLVTDRFNITNSRTVTGLGFDVKYQLIEYREGFLLYSTDLKEVYYYANVESAPEVYKLKGPKDTSLNPVGLKVSEDHIITLYSSVDANDDIHEITDATSEVIVHGTTNTTFYTFDKAISDFEMCGKNLCALSERIMSVYDLGTSKPALLYEITGASALDKIAGNTLLVTDKGVINLSANKRYGTFSYTFGDYSWCGMQPSASGYILCLIDADSNKISLKIDLGNSVTNIRDKSLLKLQKIPNIISTSIYKDILFVTPKVTERDATQKPRQGTYTDEEIERSKQIVFEAIVKSGINDSEMTIINTVNPF